MLKNKIAIERPNGRYIPGDRFSPDTRTGSFDNEIDAIRSLRDAARKATRGEPVKKEPNGYGIRLGSKPCTGFASNEEGLK